MEQLQMVWPEGRLESPPSPEVAEGYTLRGYRDKDEAQYLELIRRAGFDWGRDRLCKLRSQVLENGQFVIEHEATGRLVATALCMDNPAELHPSGGELGWLAGDPDHNGNGLGLAVCAAVTARFIRAGYSRVYLKTDDWRLAALKVYLKLGFVPFLHEQDMQERWKAVCAKLDWPFTPEEWITP